MSSDLVSKNLLHLKVDLEDRLLGASRLDAVRRSLGQPNLRDIDVFSVSTDDKPAQSKKLVLQNMTCYFEGVRGFSFERLGTLLIYFT